MDTGAASNEILNTIITEFGFPGFIVLVGAVLYGIHLWRKPTKAAAAKAKAATPAITNGTNGYVTKGVFEERARSMETMAKERYENTKQDITNITSKIDEVGKGVSDEHEKLEAQVNDLTKKLESLRLEVKEDTKTARAEWKEEMRDLKANFNSQFGELRTLIIKNGNGSHK